MKILVYGAGVLGCNLARNLLRTGKDVTLFARGNWAAGWITPVEPATMADARSTIWISRM